MSNENKDHAIEILNSIELQNRMAMKDIFGEKTKGEIAYMPADDSFGYSPENPILCNDVYGEECWLSRLRSERTGSPVIFHRVGSKKGKAHMLDIFECVTLEGDMFRLYADMYHYDQSKAAPKGFMLADRIEGLTGSSMGAMKRFPDIYRELCSYAGKAYGYPVVDSCLRMMHENEEAMSMLRNMVEAQRKERK